MAWMSEVGIQLPPPPTGAQLRGRERLRHALVHATRRGGSRTGYGSRPPSSPSLLAEGEQLDIGQMEHMAMHARPPPTPMAADGDATGSDGHSHGHSDDHGDDHRSGAHTDQAHPHRSTATRSTLSRRRRRRPHFFIVRVSPLGSHSHSHAHDCLTPC